MDDPATATLIATDATIRRSLGAWSAVFADGRAFTGAGTAVDINDAETRGALLGVEAARAAAGIVLITDSQALLDAYRAGIGALAGLPVWGGFMAAVRARGRAWPVVRRAASPCERRLHRAAHNLADAAWHAAAEGSDPAPIAAAGWQDARCSGAAVRVVRTRHGIERHLLRPPTPEEARALDYEIARLSGIATVSRPSPSRVVFLPDKGNPLADRTVMDAMARLATSPDG